MLELQKTDSILYVEDEQNIQEELAEFLEQFCETLYLAKNGKEGFELFSKHSPNIIITDIKMPKMDGIAMAKKIFASDQKAHIIFTTAFSEPEYLQQAIEIHADGYVFKPIDLRLLEDKILKSIHLELLEKEILKKTEYELNQKREFETILSTILEGIAILDFNGNFLYANQAYKKILGYSLEELQTLTVKEITFSEKRVEFQHVFEKAINGKHIEHFQNRCRKKDEKKIIVDTSLLKLPDQDKILLATKDITSEVISKQKIQEYLELIDNNIITSTTDLKGKITYASKKFSEISGYTEKELLGKSHNIVRDPFTPKEIYKELWDTIKNNQVWKGELRNKKKDGNYYWVDIKIFPIYDDEGNKVGYTSIRQDITHLKKVEELAINDALTEVYNRHYFNEVFLKYIQSAQRKDELVCFAIFDIDFFKQYNDTYGHQEGDKALQQVAKTIKQKLQRGNDLLFRLGGEEFGILFQNSSKEHAIEYTNSFLQAVSDLKIEHKKNSASPYLSISIGLVCKKATQIANDKELYKEADDLLYDAKERGRNCIVTNSEEM